MFTDTDTMTPAVLDYLTDFNDRSDNGWIRGRAGKDLFLGGYTAMHLTQGINGFSGVIYQRTLFLEIGAEYQFSMIARNYFFGAQDIMPKFRLSVESDLNTKTFTLPRNLEWHTITGTFTASKHSNLFRVYSDEDSGAGNDYYLDDIHVKQLTRGTPWAPVIHSLEQTAVPTVARGATATIDFRLNSNDLPDYPGARLEFKTANNLKLVSMSNALPGTTFSMSPDQSIGTVTVTPKNLVPWPTNRTVTVQIPASAIPNSEVTLGRITYFNSSNQPQATVDLNVRIAQTTVTSISQLWVPDVEPGGPVNISLTMNANRVPDFIGARLEALAANGSKLVSMSSPAQGTELIVSPDGRKCTVTVTSENALAWPYALTVDFESTPEATPGTEVTLATVTYFDRLNIPGPSVTLKAGMAGTIVSDLRQTVPTVNQFAAALINFVMDTNGGVDYPGARLEATSLGGLINHMSSSPPAVTFLSSPDNLKGAVTITSNNNQPWQRERTISVQLRTFVSPGSELDVCTLTYFDRLNTPGVSRVFKVKMADAVSSIHTTPMPIAQPGSSATFTYSLETNGDDVQNARIELNVDDEATITHMLSIPSRELVDISPAGTTGTLTVAPHTQSPWGKTYTVSVDIPPAAVIGRELTVGSLTYFNNNGSPGASSPLKVLITEQAPVESKFSFGAKWKDFESDSWVYSYTLTLKATQADVQQWKTSFTQLPFGTRLFTSTWAAIVHDGSQGLMEFRRPSGPSYSLPKGQELHIALQLIYPKEAGEQKRFETLWDLVAYELK
ncbi:hypothetical protein [Pseudomonas purpurea]|uniref:hypothetical protein n=1 Tax=Pseudomonas purpurea TaxID=3136737 RepID=UPI003264BA82